MDARPFCLISPFSCCSMRTRSTATTARDAVLRFSRHGCRWPSTPAPSSHRHCFPILPARSTTRDARPSPPAPQRA